MPDVISAAGMRALEAAAMKSGVVTGVALMERAGAGVVAAIIARWGDYLSAALVLCGPGNNGGDGYVVARLLHQSGWNVTVMAMGDPEELTGDACTNHRRWCALGPVHRYDSGAVIDAARAARARGQSAWVVVDALFGIGQRPPLEDVLAPVTSLTDLSFGTADAVPTSFFVSVDVPTGEDADTGSITARPFPADMIVTFHKPKPVHLMPHLADAELVVVDIGLDDG